MNKHHFYSRRSYHFPEMLNMLSKILNINIFLLPYSPFRPSIPVEPQSLPPAYRHLHLADGVEAT